MGKMFIPKHQNAFISSQDEVHFYKSWLLLHRTHRTMICLHSYKKINKKIEPWKQQQGKSEATVTTHTNQVSEILKKSTFIGPSELSFYNRNVAQGLSL